MSTNDNQNKDISPAPPVNREANNKRHDDKRVKREKELCNLQRNLLLLREAYRVFFTGHEMKFDTFYKALGISPDILTNFFSQSILSKHNYLKIEKALEPTLMPKKYYRYSNARRLNPTPKIDEFITKYFEASTSSKKDYHLAYLRSEIFSSFNVNSRKMFILIFTCKKLSESQMPSTQMQLWKTSEVLNQILLQDFSEQDFDSEAFASYVTKLAEAVNSIEKDFPAFYATAQLLKKEKSPQSLMNEASNVLQQLHYTGIQQSDAESASSLNLLHTIEQAILDIKKAYIPKNTP